MRIARRCSGGFLAGVGRFFRKKVIPGLLKASNWVAEKAKQVPVIGGIAGKVADFGNNITQKIGHKLLDAANRRHGENENG